MNIPDDNVSADPSVDLSLARGLRSSIIKTIAASKLATEKASLEVVKRKATMPTTNKGSRRLHLELARYLDKYAIAANNPYTLERNGIWFRWALRQNEHIDDWVEDLLSVNCTIFDLLNPRQRSLIFGFKVGISMHLIERVFVRLNTRENLVVTDELSWPATIACFIENFLLYVLQQRGITNLPIMLPTDNGAIVGDVIITGHKLEIKFRSFLGGRSDISDVKNSLLNDLKAWKEAYLKDVDDAFSLSIQPYNKIIENLNNPDIAIQLKHIQSYVDILLKHPYAMRSKEVRDARHAHDIKKWER